VNIYLSGGFYSGWQSQVKQGAPSHEYFNPETDSQQIAICGFVSEDIAGIDWCDLLLAYKQTSSPYHTGLAAEIGYAYAKGKIIILVDEFDRIDGFLAGMSKRVYNNLQSAIDYLSGLSNKRG